MAHTITERQADIWRTSAAMIYNATRDKDCADAAQLMVREGDDLYPGEVVACIGAAVVVVADRIGLGRDRAVRAMRQALADYDGQPVDPVRAVEVAHNGAHLYGRILVTLFGRDLAVARAHQMIEQFAAGDFGSNVKACVLAARCWPFAEALRLWST